MSYGRAVYLICPAWPADNPWGGGFYLTVEKLGPIYIPQGPVWVCYALLFRYRVGFFKWENDFICEGEDQKGLNIVFPAPRVYKQGYK
jgi:hypothetical protein